MIADYDPADALPDAEPHPHWMKLALEEAELAFGEEEVPVGAVILHQGRIVARRTISASSFAIRPPTPRWWRSRRRRRRGNRGDWTTARSM